MSRPEWPVDLEHRCDRRCNISRWVLPNGTTAATSDVALSIVFGLEAVAAWQRWCRS